ncbi:MAG: tricarballylate dehydrogenase [Pelotomaculum sp. PtaU1.Bin035]|nr:MAG: tricarballylate dehydrogenase [Pelotomaculum sp. PtaU1.Bin035]
MGGQKRNLPDVLVIGGGPAGMFAAAAASFAGAKVMLLEKNERLGRKMSITGGGRGNLTNTASLHDFIKNIPGNGKYLFSVLTRFSNNDCMKFFKSLGVPTKQKEYGRVFPVREQAGEVVKILKEHLLTSGVNIHYLARGTELLFSGCQCQGVRTADTRTYHSKTVIIATGGASYPQTGSTGDGYRLARQAGHRITPLLPGLAPLCVADQQICRQLMGLSVTNIMLTLITSGGKKVDSEQGDIIFTHFGISGPATLRLSRVVSEQTAAGNNNQHLLLDILPDMDEGHLAGKLLSMAINQPQKSLLNLLKQLFPGRLAAIFIKTLQVDGRKRSGETGKELWREAARLIKHLPVTITGARPLAEAMVTVGGIETREIDPRTMASRLAGGLYFAGEVIDVDAFTGGFNMQIAFSTGWIAGLSAAEKAGSLIANLE